MASKITRTKLRGEPLFDFCKKAKTTTHERGKDDNSVFCYGMYGDFGGECPSDCRQECKKCKAWLYNQDFM